MGVSVDFFLDHCRKLVPDKREICSAVDFDIGAIIHPEDAMRALAEVKKILMDVTHGLATEPLV